MNRTLEISRACLLIMTIMFAGCARDGGLVGPEGAPMVPRGPAASAGPNQTQIAVSGDTYLKQGHPNKNQGQEPMIRIRQSGKNRGIVQATTASLAEALGSGILTKATLMLTITDNGNNWGSTGREIAIHRLTRSSTELGATWNCADDLDTSNQRPDCSATAWEMGKPNQPALHPWVEPSTDVQLIQKFQSGTVTFDVTADVAAFLAGQFPNDGWIIKKVNEGQAGRIEFGSRETTMSPVIILEFTPPTTGFGLVAFDRGEGGTDRDVYVLNTASGVATNLTQNPATEVKPAFSPDGQWVVFASNRTGGWELFRVHTDGSGALQKLTPGPQGDQSGITGIDWRPDGAKIIYSARVSNVWRLFEIPSGGGAPSQLLSTTFGGTTMDVQWAQYSRSGTTIYYQRTTPFNAFNSDIFSADANGSNEVKLTDLPGRGAGFPTEIFVNGLPKVVYTEWNPSVGGSPHLVIMNPDGSSRVVITAEDAISEADAVGPAGAIPAALEGRVIFTKQGTGQLPALVMLASDGTVLLDPVIADAKAGDWWIP